MHYDLSHYCPGTVRWITPSGKILTAPVNDLNSAMPGMLEIINQTLLPDKLEYIRLFDADSVIHAIKVLAVRGAPAIGCAGAFGLAACAQRFRSASGPEFLAELKQTADRIKTARPTAVNLEWAVMRCMKAVAAETSPERINFILLHEALTILAEDIRLCEAIGNHGLTLLKPGIGILTHCNAGALATGGCGTALAPVYAAHAAGYVPQVFSDETRPLLQGARLTAYELAHAGVKVTTICDSMAAQVMREGKVQIVIVGADRVAANGDTANKIGTYQLAISAAFHKIPFYVAMPYSTIDRNLKDGSDIPIEQRNPSEIRHCDGADVYNPAFDVTPHELITGYITDKGVISSLTEI